MELLKQRILQHGYSLNENTLIVDSFLNHQVDAELMMRIGQEFARRFSGEDITRVATIESSGISPAVTTALALQVPMVIMKKSTSAILKDDIIQTKVFSFTRQNSYMLTVKKAFIHPNDRILFIDDFLAHGEASFGAMRILQHCGAEIVGIGAVIEKTFQNGGNRLRDAGYRVEALAAIRKLSPAGIEFV